jgi:hypothetical protein
LLRKKLAVRRHRKIFNPIDRCQTLDKCADLFAQKRFTARQSDLCDPELRDDICETDDLVVGQDLRPCEVLVVVVQLAWHAVDTSETASIGHRYPEIPHRPCIGRENVSWSITQR